MANRELGGLQQVGRRRREVNTRRTSRNDIRKDERVLRAARADRHLEHYDAGILTVVETAGPVGNQDL